MNGTRRSTPGGHKCVGIDVKQEEQGADKRYHHSRGDLPSFQAGVQKSKTHLFEEHTEDPPPSQVQVGAYQRAKATLLVFLRI